MTFNTPLTSPQLTKVRSGSYQGSQNVSLFSNRIVFKCQVNVDLSVGVVFAAFTWYNALIGAYTDVEVGQTVWVSPTTNIADWVWRGRVRLTPGAATFYVNETEANWLPNYYVFVTDVFEPWDRLSRPTTDTPPQQRVDFDETYHKMAPSILGLQYIYAGDKDTGTGKFRVTLSLTGVPIESGSSISSWLITPRSGQATLISGSYSSAVATFDLDPSTMSTWGETWFTVVATDSNGNTLTRHCGVKITDDTHPSDLSFENIQISGDIARGYTATLPAFAGVDSVLPWTLVCVWRDTESYGGVAGTLGALPNTIDHIGFLRKDDPSVTSDPKHTTLSTTSFEVLDIAGRMANIEMQQLAIQNGTTAAWDWINNVTPRRALWHYLTTHSTVPTLVDITFDPLLADDSYLFPDFSTQGNNLLAAGNGIGAQVNAAFEFGPDGSIEINRDLRHTDAATRSAAPTVMSLQATGSTNGITDDCIVIGSSRIYEDRIGVLDANGASFTVPPVYQSRAPGLAQGISQGRGTLANQVLAIGTGLQNQTEINQRAGDEFNIQNAQETITLEMPDGYVFGIPSRAQWYTLVADTNLAGPNGVSRIIYTSSVRWQLEQVRYNVKNADGDRKNEWILRRECPIGLPGYSVVIPSQPSASIVPFGVVLPAFNIDPLILPPAGVIVPPPNPTPVPLKGTTPTVEWDGTADYLSNNYPGLASPLWAGKTPSDLGLFQVKHVIADLADLSVKATPAYLLASDATNSAVWYTPNLQQARPAWVKSASYAGAYTLLRLTETPGSVEIYGSGKLQTVFDLKASAYGWQPLVGPNATHGGYFLAPGFCTGTGSAGWLFGQGFKGIQNFDSGCGCGSAVNSVDYIELPSSAGYTWHGVTSIDITVDAGGFPAGVASIYAYYQDLSGTWHGTVITPGGAGITTSTWTFSDDVQALAVDLGACDTATDIYVLKVVVNSGAGNAETRLSTDYGSTFASAVSVGTSPGALAGFDVQHGNTVTLAAADQKVRIATALGGSYSDETNGALTGSEPACIVIPWWRAGSSTVKNTSASQPDYILASTSAIAGASLWIVTSTGKHDITPTAGALVVGPNAITIWKGTRLAVLVNVSGTVHLYTGVIAAGLTVTWTDQGAFNASYLRGAYHASAAGPLFMAGPAGSWYSADWGVSVHARTSAANAPGGIEPCM